MRRSHSSRASPAPRGAKRAALRYLELKLRCGATRSSSVAHTLVSACACARVLSDELDASAATTRSGAPRPANRSGLWDERRRAALRGCAAHDQRTARDSQRDTARVGTHVKPELLLGVIEHSTGLLDEALRRLVRRTSVHARARAWAMHQGSGTMPCRAGDVCWVPCPCPCPCPCMCVVRQRHV